jgi:AAA15 family ATPase/GTPase
VDNPMLELENCMEINDVDLFVLLLEQYYFCDQIEIYLDFYQDGNCKLKIDQYRNILVIWMTETKKVHLVEFNDDDQVSDYS